MFFMDNNSQYATAYENYKSICDWDRSLTEKWNLLINKLRKDITVAPETGIYDETELEILDETILDRSGSFSASRSLRWKRLARFFMLIQMTGRSLLISDRIEEHAKREIAMFYGNNEKLASELSRGLYLTCIKNNIPRQLPWSSDTMELIRDINVCLLLKKTNDMSCNLFYNPMVLPYDDLTNLRSAFKYNLIIGETCWSPYVEATFMFRLLHEGFITIANQIRYESMTHSVLVPKMHIERCCMYPIEMKMKKKVLRRGSLWRLTVNEAFDKVIAGIVKQHGENWLYPQVQLEMHRMHYNRNTFKIHGIGLNSVEVWQGDELIAGEIGFNTGSVYTSLSGFHTIPNSGTYQMYALAAILYFNGFKMWDLGMYLAYKIDLGAFTMPRDEFINAFESAKETDAVFEVPEKFRHEPNYWYQYATLKQQHTVMVVSGAILGAIIGKRVRKRRIAAGEFSTDFELVSYNVNDEAEFEKNWNKLARIAQQYPGYKFTKMYKASYWNETLPHYFQLRLWRNVKDLDNFKNYCKTHHLQDKISKVSTSMQCSKPTVILDDSVRRQIPY
ncbi:bifunctional Acyl-CoA N-acyltransferase/Leucyl-phenylalanyl-tRNA-protein transferase [Babesia duncani]|uniref:Bifunctional Acyl-CoA N-acyltransferase/Leucyl-phenylalanyl-tRNA-protein transferase n=1 Tax=Babesia duncani TaxID=323732 RepID=A0AAD9PIH2_9APIC|nr:bifunctional Acyl-CoA N-acyltransferase/Leucyl-phenylalanyl-tRNA-protein transferase [Babesia duncani]